MIVRVDSWQLRSHSGTIEIILDHKPDILL